MIIRASGVLLRFVGYKREHEVDGQSVRDGLNKLAEANPELRSVLFDADGNVRKTHHVYLNGDRLGSDAIDHEAGPKDEIQILTAVAGG